MTGRTRGDHDEDLPPAPRLHVESRDDDVVSFGERPPASGRWRAVVAVGAALVVLAVAAVWWTTRDAGDDRLVARLDDGGRLVVDAGRDPKPGGEADVRVEVDGRQRCQNVVRLEVTGRSLCGAGSAVAVVAPVGCRVRFEPTSGPPVEADRVEVRGSGLAVAAAVVDARAVTPAVRAVVVDDRGGRQLLSDVARRVAAGADPSTAARC